MKRWKVLLAWSLTLAGACSNDNGSTTKVCPPCGANMACDEATGSCVATSVICEPACGPNANCTAAAACACIQGHSDCNGTPGDGCECATTTCNVDGTCGGDSPPPPPPPPPPPQGCQTEVCPTGKVCTDSGECIEKPTPAPSDIIARLQLRRLTQDGAAKVLGDHGEGAQEEVWFRQQETLPVDKRQTFQTADGETCFLQAGASRWLDDWPSTPIISAGNVTFNVTGAPGAIVIGAHDSGGEWFYWRDEPDNLPTGAGSVTNWFEPQYVPFGAGFTADVVGGPDLGAMSFQGQIPDDFAIVTPREELEGQQPTGDLTVKWDPPQPGASMEITLTAAYQDTVACVVKDDGEATIPAAVTSRFSLKTLLEMRRDIQVYTKVTEPLNKLTVHATVAGRVEHHRWISFEP